MQRSKTYRAAAEQFDKDELHAPLAAIKIAKTSSKKKFDETLDVVMRLGVDPRKADQMVRGTVNLPTARARPPASWSSPTRRRPRPLVRPAPTSSVATSSSRRSTAVGPTSTPSWRPRT